MIILKKYKIFITLLLLVASTTYSVERSSSIIESFYDANYDNVRVHIKNLLNQNLKKIISHLCRRPNVNSNLLKHITFEPHLGKRDINQFAFGTFYIPLHDIKDKDMNFDKFVKILNTASELFNKINKINCISKINVNYNFWKENVNNFVTLYNQLIVEVKGTPLAVLKNINISALEKLPQNFDQNEINNIKSTIEKIEQTFKKYKEQVSPYYDIIVPFIKAYLDNSNLEFYRKELPSPNANAGKLQVTYWANIETEKLAKQICVLVDEFNKANNFSNKNNDIKNKNKIKQSNTKNKNNKRTKPPQANNIMPNIIKFEWTKRGKINQNIATIYRKKEGKVASNIQIRIPVVQKANYEVSGGKYNESFVSTFMEISDPTKNISSDKKKILTDNAIKLISDNKANLAYCLKLNTQFKNLGINYSLEEDIYIPSMYPELIDAPSKNKIQNGICMF